MPINTITPQELQKQLQAGTPVDLIDVRTPVEFREIHAEIARNVPLDRIDAATIKDGCEANGTAPAYLICRSGQRAQRACEKLTAQGFGNAVSVAGGTVAWEQAGLPVTRGKKAISLERQVRMTAGFLTLVGALLAYFVSPYFFILPAFIGAGLMFAGITDTCGMAMMLAKMPWNQVSEKCGASACSSEGNPGVSCEA